MDRPFLIGERIYLRPIDAVDLENSQYLNWLNDERVIGNLESLYFPTTKAQLEEYVMSASEVPAVVFLAIIEKVSDRWIGNIKLGSIDWIKRKATYGRMIGDFDSWGKGYGTEAARLIIRYGIERLNLHKITAGVIDGNIGSIKSNQKAGMTIEATLKKEVFRKGVWTNVILMSVLAEEYYQNKD